MDRKFLRLLFLTLAVLITAGTSHSDSQTVYQNTYDREYEQPEYTWDFIRHEAKGDYGVREPDKFSPGGEHYQYIEDNIMPYLVNFGIYKRFARILAIPEIRPSDTSIYFEFVGNRRQSNKDTYADAGDRNTIRIYDKFFDDPEDKRDPGLIVHEIIHLLQWPYKDTTSIPWVSEGLADYFWHTEHDHEDLGWYLFKTKQKLKKLKKQEGQEESHFTYDRFAQSGYMMMDNSQPLHTAGLFTMINDDYIDGFPVKLHEELYKRHKYNSSDSWTMTYKDSYKNADLTNFLSNHTSRTLDSLWCEYIARAELFDPEPYMPLAQVSAAGDLAKDEKEAYERMGIEEPVDAHWDEKIQKGKEADKIINQMLAENKKAFENGSYNCGWIEGMFRSLSPFH